jgi:hypothetical protein
MIIIIRARKEKNKKVWKIQTSLYTPKTILIKNPPVRGMSR